MLSVVVPVLLLAAGGTTSDQQFGAWRATEVCAHDADSCQWAPKFPQKWAPKIPYAGGSGRSVISHIRDRIFLSSVVGHGVWAAAD